jgi:ligand-binding sensor domain-containing protein/serine phosphatase RsbU (regulator of sigma subunit)
LFRLLKASLRGLQQAFNQAGLDSTKGAFDFAALPPPLMPALAWTFILIILWWSIAPGQATTPVPRNPTSAGAVFEPFTQDQGLSNNGITCLLQDQRGFLWIGTEDGLNRYDGYGFKVYRHRPTDPNSLPANFIRALAQGPDGTLWMATDGCGLCRYDAWTDHFVSYALTLSPKERYFSSIEVSQDGLVWLGGNDGLVCFDPQTNVSAVYPLWRDLHLRSPATYVSSTLEIAPDRFLVGSSHGILLFDRQTRRFSVVLAAPPRLQKGVQLQFSGHIVGRLRDGRICVGFINWALFLLDPQTLRVTQGYDLEGRPLTGDNRGLPLPHDASQHGKAVFLDQSGSVWIFKRFSAPRRLDLATGELTFIQNTVPSGTFKAQEPMVMMQDRSGVFWFGDRINGLLKFSPIRNRFETYRHHPFDDKSLVNSYTRGILEDSRGRLWVCSQFGGISRLDRRTGQVERYNLHFASATKRPTEAVFTIYEDRRQVLWVGTEYGLHILNPEQRRLQPAPLPQLPILATQALYEDHRGHLWIGMAGRLFEVSPDRRTVTDQTKAFGLAPTPPPPDAVGDDIQCFYEDQRDRHLWIGGIYGAVRYDPVHQTHRTYRIERKPAYGVPYVTGFAEGMDGTLWMVTKGAGLCRFDPQRETFTHITEEQGLPHNNCYAMLPDTDGTFWLSSDAGLSHVDPQHLTFRTYTVDDGLQGREFNRFSAFQNARGEMFFGGTQGLTMFHPSHVKDDRSPPPVVLTKVSINGQPQPAIEGKNLTLDADQNTLEVSFAALDFHVPKNNQYQYWLEGFDRNWRDAGTRHEATYTNLPAGRYTLHVKAANHDGVWNAGTVLLQMVIRPPWWQTWPVYLCFALAGTLVLYGGLRWRLRQLTARTQALEATVAERTQEVLRKNEELIARNVEIATGKREIEIQQRNFLESLTYAQIIQRSTLPSSTEIHRALGEHFIVWKPKDIVSGDFYWVHRHHDRVIFVVADCTGHGVPGAFMSMIGNDLLGNIVIERQVLDPAELLQQLHQGVSRALKQQDDTGLPDGMEASACRLDLTTATVTFAGARQSLYVVADGALAEIKGDRHAIGGRQSRRQARVFTNHNVDLTPNTMLYLATDGFADQPDPQGQKFRTRRLRELLVKVADLPLPEQQKRLEIELAAHMGPEPQRDDITLVGVRWVPHHHAAQNGEA